MEETGWCYIDGVIRSDGAGWLLAQLKTTVDFQLPSTCSSLVSGNPVLMFFWRLNISLSSVPAAGGRSTATWQPISTLYCRGPTVTSLRMSTYQPQWSILGPFTKTIKDKMQSFGSLREEVEPRKPPGAIFVPCWKSRSEWAKGWKERVLMRLSPYIWLCLKLFFVTWTNASGLLFF